MNIQRNTLKTLLCGCLFLTSVLAFAQNPTSIEVIVNENGKQVKEDIELPMSMTYPLDSMLSDWKIKSYLSADPDCTTSAVNPTFSDSVYIDRLSRLQNIIEMPYNEIVKEFIEMYSGRLRERVSFMLSASNFYMPIFEEALDAYNLPIELKYLPIIESALNPSAVSRAGAAGLWQFMISTGKQYGLQSNSLVDERRDPIKSTWAAVRYLKDLYDIYKDWHLVIAAYNCGPGNINKAIKRAGDKADYWAIYGYLPKETRGYVPSFIAANYVMTYYCKHNICPMVTNIPVATDTIHVNRNIHLQQIADVCKVDIDELKSLNPQYKQLILPGESQPQTLRLPQSDITSFIEKEDSVCAYKANQFFRNRRLVTANTNTRSRTSASRTSSKSTSGATYHTIRRGETLSTIASRYGVTVNKLRQLNGIRGSKITAGKRLRIK